MKFKKGYKESEEIKKKRGLAISKALTGRKLSDAHRKKISDNLRGQVGEKSRCWKGGKKRYWQKKARDLMIERGFDVEGLHVHHINKNYKDNRLENIKLLTIEEHGKIHGKETENIPPKKYWFKKGNKPWNKGIKTNYQKRDKKGRFIKK